jgi:5-formyltetrahydrofolate cyclo-ligase
MVGDVRPNQRHRHLPLDPDEADTRTLITHAWERGVTVLAPAVAAGHLLRWSRIESFDLLAPGPYGILEPPASAPIEMPPPHAVAIVPCVAFDAAGYRLGWGKGYYDRFLDGFDGPSIGLAFDCQEVPELPRESHDQPVDYIVTETRVIQNDASK